MSQGKANRVIRTRGMGQAAPNPQNVVGAEQDIRMTGTHDPKESAYLPRREVLGSLGQTGLERVAPVGGEGRYPEGSSCAVQVLLVKVEEVAKLTDGHGFRA